MTRMRGRGRAGPLPPLRVEEETIRRDLETHVRTLAGTIGERHYARPAALARAVAYLHDALARLGYEVSVQSFAAGGQTFHNLEVVIAGGSRADEIVVVGGHYDTVEGSPGADDNGSGSAAVVALARLLARDRPARTVRCVLFANEEPPFFESGAMGSRGYAAQAARRGDRIVAMFALQTIGSYAGQTGLRPARPRGGGCGAGGAGRGGGRGGRGGRSIGGGRRFEESLLRAGAVARPLGAPRVGAVGGELPCGWIGELGREDAIEARACGGVAHRDGHLDAAAQGARPPVGRPHGKLGCAAGLAM